MSACDCCERETDLGEVAGRVVCIVCGAFYREFSEWPDSSQATLFEGER
jgi:hypothetical protein